MSIEMDGKLPAQITDTILKLDEQQHRYLNRIVVERLKFIHSAKAINALSKFNIGDIVSFKNYNEEIIGRIIRINQKTVSLLSLDGKSKWNVAPSFLKKVSAPYADEKPSEEEPEESEEKIIADEQINLPPGSDEKISRNAQCPCGSGKKYKKCCGQ